MAHVIEPPKPEDYEKVKCPHCLSLIGYTPNEIKERHGRDYSGGPDGESWVVCPSSGCGKKIILDSW